MCMRQLVLITCQVQVGVVFGRLVRLGRGEGREEVWGLHIRRLSISSIPRSWCLYRLEAARLL